LSDSGPSHFYFSPRCLFCNKNNGRRNSKKGRYWKCRHCGEINPGPGMLKAMVGRFTQPPASAAHTNGHVAEPITPAVNVAAATAPAAVVTKIKAAPAAAPRAVPAKPTPKAAVPKTKPTPAAAAPPAQKPSFLERVMYGS
jgi:hypothetical protein